MSSSFYERHGGEIDFLGPYTKLVGQSAFSSLVEKLHVLENFHSSHVNQLNLDIKKSSSNIASKVFTLSENKDLLLGQAPENGHKVGMPSDHIALGDFAKFHKALIEELKLSAGIASFIKYVMYNEDLGMDFNFISSQKDWEDTGVEAAYKWDKAVSSIKRHDKSGTSAIYSEIMRADVKVIDNLVISEGDSLSFEIIGQLKLEEDKVNKTLTLFIKQWISIREELAKKLIEGKGEEFLKNKGFARRLKSDDEGFEEIVTIELKDFYLEMGDYLKDFYDFYDANFVKNKYYEKFDQVAAQLEHLNIIDEEINFLLAHDPEKPESEEKTGLRLVMEDTLVFLQEAITELVGNHKGLFQREKEGLFFSLNSSNDPEKRKTISMYSPQQEDVLSELAERLESEAPQLDEEGLGELNLDKHNNTPQRFRRYLSTLELIVKFLDKNEIGDLFGDYWTFNQVNKLINYNLLNFRDDFLSEIESCLTHHQDIGNLDEVKAFFELEKKYDVENVIEVYESIKNSILSNRLLKIQSGFKEKRKKVVLNKIISEPHFFNATEKQQKKFQKNFQSVIEKFFYYEDKYFGKKGPNRTKSDIIGIYSKAGDEPFFSNLSPNQPLYNLIQDDLFPLLKDNLDFLDRKNIDKKTRLIFQIMICAIAGRFILKVNSILQPKISESSGFFNTKFWNRLFYRLRIDMREYAKLEESNETYQRKTQLLTDLNKSILSRSIPFFSNKENSESQSDSDSGYALKSYSYPFPSTF